MNEKGMLTHLDLAVGDGDIGANMKRGAEGILILLRKACFSSHGARILELLFHKKLVQVVLNPLSHKPRRLDGPVFPCENTTR